MAPAKRKSTSIKRKVHKWNRDGLEDRNLKRLFTQGLISKNDQAGVIHERYRHMWPNTSLGAFRKWYKEHQQKFINGEAMGKGKLI